MRVQGAVIREQGQTFAVVVVKPHVVQNRAEAASAISSFMPIFGGVPVVLMAQDSRGRATYYGRPDISRIYGFGAASGDPLAGILGQLKWKRSVIGRSVRKHHSERRRGQSARAALPRLRSECSVSALSALARALRIRRFRPPAHACSPHVRKHRRRTSNLPQSTLRHVAFVASRWRSSRPSEMPAAVRCLASGRRTRRPPARCRGRRRTSHPG